MKYLIISLLIALPLVVSAQITEKPGFGKFALMNATIHTVTDGVIESGIVLIDGQTISFVGQNVKPTPDYTIIDYAGKHIYPGLIDAGTTLGLVEISAVPVTADNAELGNFNPHVRAFTAINPNSVAIPVTRVEGITTVISHPTSGILSGRASLINLYGYSADSMAVLENAAMYMNWPSSGRRGGWDQRTDEQITDQFNSQLKAINQYWIEAKFYHQMMNAYESNPMNRVKPDKNQRLEGMRGVFTGEMPVVVTADRENDIVTFLNWMSEYPDIRFILNSVAEGWRVADKIAEAGIPCIVGPVLRTPSRAYDNYQRPYQNAGLLHQAGVKVAIRTGSTENVRNLIFNAGYAATYGMGTDEALRAVTIVPAEIFGVDHLLGSISVGKVANLVISNGDILETTSQVEQVFIMGYKIPMTSRHTQLFEQYLNRDAVSN